MNLGDQIVKYADSYKVPSQIAVAVAQTESDMLMTALRYEPNYRYLWDNKHNRAFKGLTTAKARAASPAPGFTGSNPSWGWFCNATTEWHMQKTSWGPFQMMGSVLRENGYIGPFPAICADEALAALWGVRHLSMLRDAYYSKHGWNGVVAAYNAGRPRLLESGRYVNQEYVNKISRAGAQAYVTIG